MTNLHNHSPEMLADELGQLSAQIKDLQAREKAIKAELKARKIKAAHGRHFAVTVAESIRQSLDSKAVRETMGQDWFDDHSKLSEVVTIRTTALAA
ncbi:MAG: hypothetical protein AAF225_08150 [Pseudomonadota bacterium]